MEFKQYIIGHDFDIFITSETKIDTSVHDSELGLADFDIYQKDRDHNGGGVLVGVKKLENQLK